MPFRERAKAERLVIEQQCVLGSNAGESMPGSRSESRGVVDDALGGGVGADEGLDGQVVDRTGEAAADLVDEGDVVVAKHGVAAGRRVGDGGRGRS